MRQCPDGDSIKLKRTLPPNRTFEQLRNHYLVERRIANQLKKSSRADRKKMYATMYDELFEKVPDHPRLTRRKSLKSSRKVIQEKLPLVKRFLTDDTVFAEFGPGDCRFTMEIAKHVRLAIGIDISDQRNKDDIQPENFKLHIYNGFNLTGISSNSFDVAFSDQLIEHLHPDDTFSHFKLVYKILKKGGVYIFRTPHSITGPHDISKYFCDMPEGFHLKEWNYAELKSLLQTIGFAALRTHVKFRKKKLLNVPFVFFEYSEYLVSKFPRSTRQKLGKRLFRRIIVSATK